MATGTQTELSQLNIKQATTDDIVRQMEEQGKLGANEIIVTPKGTAVPMMPVGSIFMSAIPQTDARVHLLDGSTISQTGMYETFANKIKGLSNMWIPIACTQEEFDADVQATGNCGKFVIDNDDGTIRLPKITTFIQGLTDISNIGSSLSAGLPNITGAINNVTGLYGSGNAPVGSGSFSTLSQSTQSWGTGSTAQAYGKLDFDASRSSDVYGNSTTVQPNATQYPYYIVLASGYKSSEVIDIDNIMNEVNSKLSKNDLYLKYPVGSLYISTNPTSPADAVANGGLGGGVWEQLPEGLALWTTQSEITNEDTVVEPNASNASVSRMLYSGLPDITGQFSFTDNNSTDMRVRTGYCGGAFYSINSGASKINSDGTPSAATNGGDVGMKASRSSDRYGKSSIVQPPAYKVYAWKRVG